MSIEGNNSQNFMIFRGEIDPMSKVWGNGEEKE